jgi:hypothetical protein
MADVQEQLRQFQWIKGDNFGVIVDLKNEDSEFLNFTDGSRIFKTVSKEFIKEVIEGVIPLPGANKLGNKVAGKKDSVEAKKVEVPVLEPEPTKEPSVMGKMITKMSKKNVVNVPIKINLNIPTPGLYAMLTEGMETEDLNEEIMEVALSQIELDKLQDYIKGNISSFLEEYYS